MIPIIIIPQPELAVERLGNCKAVLFDFLAFPSGQPLPLNAQTGTLTSQLQMESNLWQ